MSCGIYKITNKVNNKAYIGQSVEIEQRWKKHLYANDDYVIHRALRKYGKDNFTFEILEECPREQLDTKERFYIALYQTELPTGYNMNSGGLIGLGLSKGRAVAQYDLFGNFITEYHSANEAARETGVPHSDICRCCRKETVCLGNYQWKYVDDTERIIENIFSPQLFLRNWPIQKYTLDGTFVKEYANFAEACKDNIASKSSLCVCLKKKTMTSGNYLWIYKGDKLVLPPKGSNCGTSRKKAVIQYDLEGNFIQEFDSVTEASKITKIALSTIAEVANGKRKTAGNYIWKYKYNI